MYVLDIIHDTRIKVLIEKVESWQKIDSDQFIFNWSVETDYDIYSLSLAKSGEILGLISLDIIFKELRVEIRLLEISTNNIGSQKRYDRIAGILIAYACEIAFISGFGGFISLYPKTKLIAHYEEKYGFEPYGNHLMIELNQSENLINKYLFDE